MFIRLACSVIVASLLVLSASERASAAQPGLVLIQVKNMHCLDCAKKIARKLYVVPGVVSVKTYVKKNTALVTPQQRKTPSPRALWEAVEKAGFQPVKLVAPAGVFTSKPGA